MRVGDMIVNLTHLPEYSLPEGVKVKRAFPGEKERILQYIRDNFGKCWPCEAEHALMAPVSQCFIATRAGKIIGFSCYDSSARGFFGPIGVSSDERGNGVGKALLLRTLNAMYEYGYIYAVIGWVGEAAGFYQKTVAAEWIPGGEPENSVYRNMIDM